MRQRSSSPPHPHRPRLLPQPDESVAHAALLSKRVDPLAPSPSAPRGITTAPCPPSAGLHQPPSTLHRSSPRNGCASRPRRTRRHPRRFLALLSFPALFVRAQLSLRLQDACVGSASQPRHLPFPPSSPARDVTFPSCSGCIARRLRLAQGRNTSVCPLLSG
jgi:hypothetical protein